MGNRRASRNAYWDQRKGDDLRLLPFEQRKRERHRGEICGGAVVDDARDEREKRVSCKMGERI